MNFGMEYNCRYRIRRYMNENNTLLTGKYHAYMLISCNYEYFTSREKAIERAMPILTDEIENYFSSISSTALVCLGICLNNLVIDFK